MSESGEVTVLLVEDNDDNRVIYRTMLEHEGYRVLEAVDGEEALRRAREDHPDLILMDISIPILNGWEATRILKADAATAKIPVIALTAHALSGDRSMAEEVGCDGYLPKPVPPQRVAAEVRERIGPPGAR
jgi:two-component system cell cycle response regulator DivK